MGRMILVVAAVMLSVGCVSHSNRSPYTVTSAVCDNPGLDSQHVMLKDKSRGWKGAVAVGLPKGGGALAMGRDRTDVERTYESAGRMEPISPEIDAKYRAAVSTCKSYVRCMEQTNQDERLCGGARANWKQANDELTALAAGYK